MKHPRIAIVVVLLFGATVAVWWARRDRGGDTPATPPVTQSGSAPSLAATRSAEPARPSTIEVRVTDARGPIAGASVRIAPDDADVVVATTDARGVAVAALQPGSYAVSASAIDHLPAALPPRHMVAGEDVKLAITLALGGRTLSGIVTDVSGGPIVGARIDAAKLAGEARPSTAIAMTTTGADGRYRVTVAEGQLLVAARSADYAPQSRYVEVGASGATADFALVPGGAIEGVVLDEQSKQPVPGAAIAARRDSPVMWLAEAGGHHVIANANGRFRLTGLRPGVYELDARGDGRRSKSPTVVGLGVAEQVADIQILVGVGAVVRGKVVDESDAPVANATVFAIGGDDEARSDATGAFALEGITPGKHALLARSDGHVSTGMTSIELADKDLDGVVVRVRRGTTIKGHVEPRQVADVRLESDEAALARPSFVAPITTATDGEFELGPVLAGMARLSARCPSGDQGAVEIAIAPGMTEIVVTVTAGASIAGRVVDGDDKPVQGVTVMAAPVGTNERVTIVYGMVTSGIQGVSGPNGAYALHGLVPGSYRMTVLDRGRPLRMRKPPPTVKLAAAEAKTAIDLAVDRPNGVIKGIVTGPDGKPLADAWVSAQQDFHTMLGGVGGGPVADDGPEQSRMVTVEARDEGDAGGASEVPPVLSDAQGRFEITGLTHTKYDVVAEAKAGTLRGRVGAVTPDASLTINVLGVTSLSGRVRGAHGPTALFEVDLEGPTTAHRSFSDGAFALGRVDPGSYTVRVTSSDGNGEAKVVVSPDTPATVDIVLVANAVVTGVLVDADNKPVAGVAVVVIDDSGDGRVSVSIEGPPLTSGPDGKFRIEHKAGMSALVVMKPPRPIVKNGLALEAGKSFDVGTIRVVAEPTPR